MKIIDQYKNDEEFRRYVDAYAKQHNITAETAMIYKIMQAYGAQANENNKRR